MRFVIPKGQVFYCEFTVKEPGESTPMDLTGATGTFTLITIGENPCIAVEATSIAVVDATNGIISISLTAEQTADLVGRKGFAEDGYPLIPTYRGSLEIHTTEEIFVDIPKVYIIDDGSSCPA